MLKSGILAQKSQKGFFVMVYRKKPQHSRSSWVRQELLGVTWNYFPCKNLPKHFRKTKHFRKMLKK